MEFINKIRLTIEGLEQRDLYKYLTIVLSILMLLLGFVIYRYYSKVGDLRRKINAVNDVREENVRGILKRMNNVAQQRKQVNDILAKEKDFKIAGYFTTLLKRQKLTNNMVEDSTSEVVLNNKYKEIILKARFVNMTMQKLCFLLDAIEKKERVYNKNLEIIRSTKTPGTIDVNMTIATLQPNLEVGR